MKNQILYFFLFISVFSCKGGEKKGNIPESQNRSDTIATTNTKDSIARDSAIAFLQDFYKKYIVATDSLETISHLQNANVTKRFLKEKQEKDYDLLTFAQDIDPEAAKNINVSYLKGDKYKVCYLYSYIENTNYLSCLAVKLVKEKNKLLIDDVEEIYEKILGKSLDKESSFEKYVSSIFYKDGKGNLQIDSKKLEYISKNTTREHSDYLIALEDYGYSIRNSEQWSIDEFCKISAYIFNTSYPLRKKYWSDKYEQWYTGKPYMTLGARGAWEKNDYYGLPRLHEYVRDFIITHDFYQY